MYTTYNNLILIKSVDELTQLTDGSTTPDQDKIVIAIEKASRYIDSFLFGSVNGWENGTGIVPFPSIITDICNDLSIFFLYNIKYGETTSIYEEKGIYKRYQMAIQMLEKIQQKKIIISSVEKTLPTMQVYEIDEIFTSELLNGY